MGVVQRERNGRALAWLAAVLVLITLPYAWFAVRNGFVWLDHREILEGGLVVTNAAELVELLWNDRNHAGYYRPVYNLLHSFDAWLWGTNDATGFHLSSLVLHLANAALVFALCRAFAVGRGAASALVLLWGLHPLGTVVVGLIHAKADLFVVTGCAASLFVAVRGTRPWHVGAALAPLLLALYTKETAYVFVGGLALFARPLAQRTRHFRPYFAGAALLTAAAALHRLAIVPEASYASPLALGERLATSMVVYCDTFRRIVLPLEPSVADTVTSFSALARFEQLRSIALFAALVGLQAVAWRRSPRLRVWIALFHLALLPVAQLVPILHFRADRFLYIPTLAVLGAVVCVGVPSALERLSRTTRAAVSTAAVLICVALYGALDVRALRGFVDDETLFERELARDPCYLEGLSHLARRHELRGELLPALELYRASLEPCPGTVSFVETETVLVNVSAILLRMQRWQDAYEWLEHAESRITTAERLRPARYNRAVAARATGRAAEALALFEEELVHDPLQPSALFFGGMSAFEAGDPQAARELLTRYLAVRPNAPDRGEVERVLDALKTPPNESSPAAGR